MPNFSQARLNGASSRGDGVDAARRDQPWPWTAAFGSLAKPSTAKAAAIVKPTF
jgi:hypothetical protein